MVRLICNSGPRSFKTYAATLALTLLAVFGFMLVTVSAISAAEIPKVGSKAADFELEALAGGKTKLSTLLKKGPVVLVVLRGYPGYQCPLCTKQVAELMGKAKAFSEANAQVLLVYPGPAENLKQHADEFVQGNDIPANFQFVLDPDFAVVSKYGLRWDAPNETSYPSTFVLDGTGKVLFAKISHSHGNRAKTNDILQALGK